MRRPSSHPPALTPPDAYASALRLLARRELSEAQVRDRLARRGCAAREIEDAIVRLRASRALDDRRVATACARTQVLVKHRGRARVERELAAIGIAGDIARDALADVYGEFDESTLIEQELARRLRLQHAVVADRTQFRRIYQQLVRQGFAPEAVMAALLRRCRAGSAPSDE